MIQAESQRAASASNIAERLGHRLLTLKRSQPLEKRTKVKEEEEIVCESDSEEEILHQVFQDRRTVKNEAEDVEESGVTEGEAGCHVLDVGSTLMCS